MGMLGPFRADSDELGFRQMAQCRNVHIGAEAESDHADAERGSVANSRRRRWVGKRYWSQLARGTG
jgi:hypothetical protein